MSTLLIRLAGPLQAWGDSSRFSRRHTRGEPTKSGVLGLLAAADGRRRTDPIEDLAALSFGVRVDQRGRLLRDFQTARSLDGTRVMPLSYRYYLSDAVFVAAVAGDRGLLEGLEAALRAPAYPLYLGRRSCVPVDRLDLGVTEAPLIDALREVRWQAAPWYRRKQGRRVSLELVVDASAAPQQSPESSPETVRDLPVSFDPRRREYGWRDVVRPAPHEVDNPLGSMGMDFMAVHGGS